MFWIVLKCPPDTLSTLLCAPKAPPCLVKEITADGGWEEVGYSSPLIPLHQARLVPHWQPQAPPGVLPSSPLVPPGPVELALRDCTIPS